MKTMNLEKKYILQTYKRNPIEIQRCNGKFVWDSSGKKYLDLFCGISVNNLGHQNKKVTAAIKNQLSKYIHISNLYYAKPQAELAMKLVKLSFPGVVFLSNSGAEANECAIKLARKYGYANGKNEIISFKNSFHGRTIATLSATGQEKYHKNFEVLPGFKFAEFNNIESVKKLINKKTVAVIIEPILGEGGVVPAKKEFLKDLKALCKKNGLILIFDEIQTGIGRTGEVFAFKHFGVVPDVFTLAKGLAGGLPLGATIISKKLSNVLSFGDHGSTFGGNPVSCSVAKAVLEVLDAKMLSNIKELGKYFLTKLSKLKDKYDFVVDARGVGLMLGLELTIPCAKIVPACAKEGFLINCIQEKVLRFLPPFIINKSDIDKFINKLNQILKGIKK